MRPGPALAAALVASVSGCALGAQALVGPTVDTRGEVGFRAGLGLSIGPATRPDSAVTLRSMGLLQPAPGAGTFGVQSALEWQTLPGGDDSEVWGFRAGVRLSTASAIAAREGQTTPVSLGLGGGPAYRLAGGLKYGHLLWIPSTAGLVASLSPDLELGVSVNEVDGERIGFLAAGALLDWTFLWHWD